MEGGSPSFLEEVAVKLALRKRAQFQEQNDGVESSPTEGMGSLNARTQVGGQLY